MSSFDEVSPTRRLIAVPVAIAAMSAALIGVTQFEHDSWQFYALEGGAGLGGLAALFLLFPQLTPRQQTENFFDRLFGEDSLPRRIIEAGRYR
jgi:hypothetical protein